MRNAANCEQTTDNGRSHACIGGFRKRVACHVQLAPHNKNKQAKLRARLHTLVLVQNEDFALAQKGLW